MLAFIDDADMDPQVARTIATAYSGSADVGEVLAAVDRIAPGDYDSWWSQWSSLAEITEDRAVRAAEAGHDVSAVKGFLRATEYWRQAWFFLRHDLTDDRLQSGWRRHRGAFRWAVPLLPGVAEMVEVPFEGARMEGYFLRPDPADEPRPTIVIPCGYDSTAEAGWSSTGYMGLVRGYNVFVVEGPGQGGMLYEQHVPLRPDFEAPLGAMLDDLLARPGVDPDRVALIGRSFAGYLAPRAAAADHRIAALVCDPGQVEFASRVSARMPADTWRGVLEHDPTVEQDLQGLLDGPRNNEYYGARMATHGQTTVAGMFREMAAFDCTALVPDIRCPILVTEGEGDFASQSELLMSLLPGNPTLVRFSADSGGGGHCEGLGATLFEEVVFDWLDTTLGQH